MRLNGGSGARCGAQPPCCVYLVFLSSPAVSGPFSHVLFLHFCLSRVQATSLCTEGPGDECMWPAPLGFLVPFEGRVREPQTPSLGPQRAPRAQMSI